MILQKKNLFFISKTSKQCQNEIKVSNFKQLIYFFKKTIENYTKHTKTPNNCYRV